MTDSLSEARGSAARATMRDVALLAGVSIKTVSRVINGERGVSPALARRVHDATLQLGFRPDQGARSLRRTDRRTATIGLLLADVENPFSAALHRAVEDVARARGVAVVSASVDDTPERERDLVAALSARRVDGLVIMPAARDQTHLELERRCGMHVVFVDRTPTGFDADSVVTDNVGGAVLATRHLLAGGHRRIAFLGDRVPLTTTEHRREGFLEAMRAAHADVPADRVVTGLTGIDEAQAATDALLAGPAPPTALFTGQNLVTIGAIRALRRHERHHDVALVGFDDFLLADLLDPPVTVVAQDPRTIGRRAAELLFRRIDGVTGPPVHEVLPARLVSRGSGEIVPR